MKSKFKKLFAVFMSALLLITNIDIKTFAALVDIDVTKDIEYRTDVKSFGFGYDFRDAGFGGIYATDFVKLSIKEAWYVNPLDKDDHSDVVIDAAKVANGEEYHPIYCLDATVSAGYVGESYQYTDAVIEDYNKISDEQRDYLNYAIMYGYTTDTNYGGNSDEEQVATQIVIWMIRHNWFNASLESAALEQFTEQLNDVSTDSVNISKTKVKNIYYKMKNNILNHDLRVSFDGQSRYWAYDTATRRYYCSFTDTNGLPASEISKYNFQQLISYQTRGAVTATISGSTLTFWADEIPDADIKLTATKTASPQFQSNIRAISLFSRREGTPLQPMLYYTTRGAEDPPTATVELLSDNGIQIIKKWTSPTDDTATLETNYVTFVIGSSTGQSTVQATQTGDGEYVFTAFGMPPTSFKLGSDGTFFLSGLPDGSYTATETFQSTTLGNRYGVTTNAQTIVVTNGTGTITFENYRRVGNGQIIKKWETIDTLTPTDISALESGIWFTVQYSDGRYVKAMANTTADADGNDLFNGTYSYTELVTSADDATEFVFKTNTGTDSALDISGLPTGTYTVTEYSNLPNYPATQSATLTVTEGQTSSVTFENIENSKIYLEKEFNDYGLLTDSEIKAELEKVYVQLSSTSGVYLNAEQEVDSTSGEVIPGRYHNATLSSTPTKFTFDEEGKLEISLSAALSLTGVTLNVNEFYTGTLFNTDSVKVVQIAAQTDDVETDSETITNQIKTDSVNIYKEWSASTTLSDADRKLLEQQLTFSVKNEKGLFVQATGSAGNYTFTGFGAAEQKFSLGFTAGGKSNFTISGVPIGSYTVTEYATIPNYPESQTATLTATVGGTNSVTFKNIENTKIVIEKTFEDSDKLTAAELQDEFDHCKFYIKRDGVNMYLMATELADGSYNEARLVSQLSQATEFLLDDNGRCEIVLNASLSSLGSLTSLTFVVSESYSGTYYEAAADKTVTIESNSDGYYNVASLGFHNTVDDGQGNIKKEWSNEITDENGTMTDAQRDDLEKYLSFTVEGTVNGKTGYIKADTTAVNGRYDYDEVVADEVRYTLVDSKFEITNLPVGTYTVTEYCTHPNYPAKQTKTLVVTSDTVSTATFKNVENTKLELHKTFSDEDTLSPSELATEYGKVSFSIKDENGKYLNATGSAGAYTNAVLGNNIQYFTLDTNGDLSIKFSTDLSALGCKLTITESYTGTDYTVASPRTVTISANTNGYVEVPTTEFVNVLKDGNIWIDKTFLDENGSSITVTDEKLKLVEFNVKTEDGKYLTFTGSNGVYTYSGIDATGTKLKLSTGYELKINGLPSKNKYTVSEITGVTGFNADVSKTYEVIPGNTITDIFKNEAMTGDLVIQKVSKDGVLSGWKFNIEYVDDIFDGYSYSVQKTTDANGKIVLENLRIGEYKITEIVDDATKAIYFTAESETVEVTYNNTVTSVQENIPKGTAEVKKVDRDYPDVTLTGAEFTVYTDVNSNGKYDAGTDTVFGVMTETGTGTGVYSLKDIPYNDYLVKETSVPDGYLLDSAYYPFSIKTAGQKAEVTIKNSPEEADFYFDKLCADGNVSGWNFLVECISSEYLNYTFSKTYTSDANGRVTVEGVRPGVYRITEVVTDEIKDKYITANSFTVDLTDKADGSVTDAGDVTNTPIGTVFVRKVDELFPGLFLKGAVFEVYKDANGNGKYDVGTDTLVGSLDEKNECYYFDANDNGYYNVNTDTYYGEEENIPANVDKSTLKACTLYELGNLTYGSFLLTEKTAPEGYVRDTNFYPFNITNGGERIEVATKPGVGFINKPQTGTLVVQKQTPDGKLEGWKFKVELVSSIFTDYVYSQSFTTDEDGKITVSDLRIGTYKVTEVTTGVVGYFTPDAEDVVIEFGKTTTVEMENIPYGSVHVTKVDKDYPDNKLTGAEFTVYDSDKTTVIGKLTEIADGEYQLDKLPYGEYWLKETKAPENYVLDNNYYAFAITTAGEVIEVETEAGKNFINNPQTGTLVVQKHTPDGKLSGWHFRIELISSQFVGYTYDKTFTTNSTGKITVPDLRIGTYKVTELTTGVTNYFTPDSQNAVIKFGETTTVEMENVPYGSVHVTKVDKDYPDNKLTGAEFTVYDSDKTTVIGKLTEIADGEYQLDKLPYGEYWLKETKAPEFYVLDDTYYSFSITEAGTVEIVENDGLGKNFLDDAMRGTLVVQKKTVDGKLEGWKFLVELVDSVYEDYTYSKEFTTDKDGKITAEDLRIGTYKVTELTTSVVNYFTPDAEDVVIKFGETTTVEMENVPYGSVHTTKVDENYPDNKLSGAVFKVYAADKKTEIGTLTEVAPGEYQLDKLVFGTYYLYEEVSPEFYEKDDNFYKFVIDEAGEIEVVETEAGKSFLNKPQTGALVINKNSADGIIEGWKFTVKLISTPLKNYTYEETFTTDENGRISVEGLVIGVYEVYEEAEGIVGYFTPEKQEVEIKVNTKTTIVMENVPYGTITLNKVNAEDVAVALPGATYNIYNDVNGNGTYEEDVDTFYSTLDDLDGDGIYTKEFVPVGLYLIKEMTPPEAFVIDETYYSVEINVGGDSVAVTNDDEDRLFLENPIKGGVHVTKVDADYTHIKLEGAEFTVYAEDKTTVIGTLVEIAPGEYELTGLLYGSYYLQETRAPEHFVRDENFYPFEIVEDGVIVTVGNTEPTDEEATRTFANRPQTGKLKVVKTAYDGKIEGISFDITIIPEVGETQTITRVTDKNGEINLENIRVGTVIVHEVLNLATYGYTLPADKTLVIARDELAQADMYNAPPPDIPQTAVTLGITAPISAIALALLVLKRKKEQK